MSDMQKVVCRRKVIKCGIGGGGVKTHFTLDVLFVWPISVLPSCLSEVKYLLMAYITNDRWKLALTIVNMSVLPLLYVGILSK